MLNAQDNHTFQNIRLLYDTIKENNKPILFWFGAGVSKWCGYSLWKELAENLHVELLKYESDYDPEIATSLLSSANYPKYFGICKNNFPKRYNKFLSNHFTPKKSTSVYERFVNIISEIKPLHIITTNVDEQLETSLDEVRTIQRTDIEYCLNAIQSCESFVCKIHGSISSLESLIFTDDDYSKLLNDQNYIVFLKQIFSLTTVVFIGYGLGDEYIIKLMLENESLKKLFGDGPHFAVLPDNNVTIPPSTKIINYLTETHRDHRSSIQVIEEIKNSKSSDSILRPDTLNKLDITEIKSAHLLSHIFPPGTWNSSENVHFSRGGSETGPSGLVVVGNGFDNSEFPVISSTAMHDLIVGLLCFDVVFCPLSALNRVHGLIGSEHFWELIKSGCLEFIEWKSQEGIIFPTPNSIAGGDLGSLEVFDKDKKEKTIQDTIRRHIIAAPRKETTANDLFSLLEQKTRVISASQEPSIPKLVRGLLLRPSLRNMIGMSGGTRVSSIPQWMKFSVLRLANVVKIGATCQTLGIASTKLEFGTASLAGLAFSATTGKTLSDEMASYVLTGRFDMDLGKIAITNKQILPKILQFRETQAGEALRIDILEQLSLGLGGDLVTSINAGLSSAISVKTLQAARDKFSGLNIPKAHNTGSISAVWNDLKVEENALRFWRKRSQREFSKYCEKEHVQLYDSCPCGSGEKVKFCCKEALNE